ncbi:MAG TPA: GNAT family N-acetyltransferase [Xanthobacteraceae bacterium]|nr:GNAT family N-acetyltransferase [Xanthobacteraceae bacterium]
MHGVIAQLAAPHGDGRVEVVSRSQLTDCRQWRSAFGEEAKDRRYYELVEDTIHREFDYRYFVVRDRAGEICAVQPFFVLDLDLLVGIRPRFGRAIDAIRRFWPRFMRARTMMVGCAAGEGHVDGKDEFAQARGAGLLASAIVDAARQLKTRLVVLKEFPAKYRSVLQCFVDRNFTRIPSMPNVRLNIDYASFNEYMTRALSGNTRKKLRMKLRAAETAPPIEMSVIDDIAPIIDEVYPLYLAVHDRSDLHFETLTKEYFCALGRRIGDKNRFFVWRQNGKVVAFGSCLVQGDAIHAEYLGLDYTVALDLHLYHYTFRDLISWGIANGYKWFNSTSLNYDPKLHLRYLLAPIDLYVRHTSAVGNALLRRLLPWLEPTRYDATLKKFANYDELWAPTDRVRRAAIVTAFAAVLQSSHAAWSALAKLL